MNDMYKTRGVTDLMGNITFFHTLQLIHMSDLIRNCFKVDKINNIGLNSTEGSTVAVKRETSFSGCTMKPVKCILITEAAQTNVSRSWWPRGLQEIMFVNPQELKLRVLTEIE